MTLEMFKFLLCQVQFHSSLRKDHRPLVWIGNSRAPVLSNGLIIQHGGDISPSFFPPIPGPKTPFFLQRVSGQTFLDTGYFPVPSEG